MFTRVREITGNVSIERGNKEGLPGGHFDCVQATGEWREERDGYR